MASQRLAIIVSLIAVFAAYAVAKDLVVGSRVPGDHLIKNATIVKKSRPWAHHVIVGYGDGSNITQVRAIDNDIKNNASISILAGGVNSHFVILHVGSKRRHGLNVTVEVHGKRNETSIERWEYVH